MTNKKEYILAQRCVVQKKWFGPGKWVKVNEFVRIYLPTKINVWSLEMEKKTYQENKPLDIDVC
jgi:hypothetical protein